MKLITNLQKLQAILILELKVARMRVRLAGRFLRKKMQELLEVSHRLLRVLKRN